MMEEIRVGMVNDRRLVAEAMELLLISEGDIRVVAIEEDAEAAIETFWRECPDVVVMDIDLPGMNGIDATRRLRKVCPNTQIVVMTALTDPALISRAVEEGACGFVPKQRAGDGLIRVVRAAAAGGSVELAGETRRSVGRLRRTPDAARGPEHILTSRELEVFQGLADGLSTAELAAALFLSRRTVQGHVQSILDKLGVRSKLVAVLYGLRHGIVQLRTESGRQARADRRDPA